MKKFLYFFSVVLALSFVLATRSVATVDNVDKKFVIKSSAFGDNQRLPEDYTCDGKDISPPLSWENVPKGTSSFVLICDDPDAPLGTYDHWVMYNIPASVRRLDEGFGKIDESTIPIFEDKKENKNKSKSKKEEGEEEIIKIEQGKNSARRFGYKGACPPRGDKPHRYFFTLYAIDLKKLEFEGKKDVTKDMVIKKIDGHVIEQTTIMATFGRKL